MDISPYLFGIISAVGAAGGYITAILIRRFRKFGPRLLEVKRRYRRYQHSRRFKDSTSLWRGHLPDAISKNMHEDLRRKLRRRSLSYGLFLVVLIGLAGSMPFVASSPISRLLIAAIVLIVGGPVVVFTLWYPHKTFFSDIYLKAEKEKVDWTKYYIIGGYRDTLERTPRTLLVPLLVVLILGPIDYFIYDGHIPNEALVTSIVFPIVLLLMISLMYSKTVWDLITESQALDEYHPTLADWITDDAEHDNMIKAPMRCNKDDTHNICLKIKLRGNYNQEGAHESDYLEAELQAAGVKQVRGALTQRKNLAFASPDFLFFWNCNFDTPGTHLINLLLRVTTKEGAVKQELLRKSHEILVTTPYRKYGPALVTTIVTALTFVFSLRAYMGLTW
jgi:hypothetical protein